MAHNDPNQINVERLEVEADLAMRRVVAMLRRDPELARAWQMMTEADAKLLEARRAARERGA